MRRTDALVLIAACAVIALLIVGCAAAGGAGEGDTRRMYWTDFGKNRIRRADLDGVGIVDLVGGLGGPSYFPSGIALEE